MTRSNKKITKNEYFMIKETLVDTKKENETTKINQE